MKRKILKMLPLLAVFVAVLVHSQPVRAEVDYDLENNVAIAQVNNDGSLTMKRQITYKFNDNARGVYYKQNLGVGQTIANDRVLVQDNNEASRPAQKYTIERSNEGYRFKVYHAVSKGNSLTVTYKYTIKRAVTNFRDTAELNFMIIGNGWDTNIKHVEAKVLFPGPVKGLKAWAHGPLTGKIKVLPKKGQIVMTVDNLDGHTGVEVHTIFPISVTAGNQRVVNEDHRQYVLDQEAKLAREANHKRWRDNIFYFGLLAISLISGLRAIFVGFAAKQQGFKPTNPALLPHNYELPQVDPVSAQVLDRGAEPDSRAFTAYLLELAVQKKIKIEDYQVGRKTFYRITLLKGEITKEDPLLDTLFNSLGDGKSFTTDQLKHYHGKQLGKSFDIWAKYAYNDVADRGLLSLTQVELAIKFKAKIIIALCISFSTTLLAIMLFKRFVGPVVLGEGLILVLGIISLVVGSKRIGIYTAEGADETNKVRGFKHMLQDIGRFNMRDVGDLMLWEDIMPYAVTFGLATKVIKEMKVEFTDQELAQSTFYNDRWLYYNTGQESFAESFNTSFLSGVATGSSAAGGSSGGFSGGSSGGFGGGSGGGAF
ncbi:DUF2207 domain-containing protein [Lactobacillus xylocopicola]|uniref:Membrane protein n=1 Tax=Lactobacillus xylocopicola TaxID=2976676 RepID=A0ABM8BHF8_9LACO|nr:DUF2207 domain-containing protein [Lactobacillus xylocopicola]BDR60709.1 membrane protein [Lactobacillus xylocopicola]